MAAQPPVCKTVTADQVGQNGLQTAAIQQQIDACAGGPAPVAVELAASQGPSFVSGALYLPSNVVLWLDAGVTLNASTNPADFQRTASSRTLPCDSSGAIPVCGSLDANQTGCAALINACKASSPGVGGPGTIEGHGWSPLTGGPNAGTTWWALAGQAKAGNYAQSLNAPQMIDFQQSTDVTLSGFTIQNAPLVHILFGKVTGGTVSQVHIVTPTRDHANAAFPYNSDGMDLSGSSNIQVDGVDIADGDDNIALEGGGNGPVTNVTVSNSTFRAGHGLSIGSPTSRGVTNVKAANLVFIGTDNGLRIKSDASNGGVARCSFGKAQNSKKVQVHVYRQPPDGKDNALDKLKKREYFERFGIADELRDLAEDHPFQPRMAVIAAFNPIGQLHEPPTLALAGCPGPRPR